MQFRECFHRHKSNSFLSIPDTAKHNPATSSVTKKDVESQIMNWFDGSRDRGEDSRKKNQK